MMFACVQGVYSEERAYLLLWKTASAHNNRLSDLPGNQNCKRRDRESSRLKCRSKGYNCVCGLAVCGNIPATPY